MTDYMRAEQRRKERARRVIRNIIEVALQNGLDNEITIPKQKGRMVEFKIYFFPEQYKKLKKLSILSGQNMSEILRDAFEDYLNKIGER